MRVVSRDIRPFGLSHSRAQKQEVGSKGITMTEAGIGQHKGAESGVDSLSTEASTVRELGPYP